MFRKITLLTAVLLFAAARAQALEKWIYVLTNLRVEKNIDDLEALMQRGEAAGYDHILLSDAKFSRLAEMDESYFHHVERVKQLAAQHHLEIVPTLFPIGYSNELLSQDVNLIEALPVKNTPLTVRGGVAVVDDPDVPKLPADFSDWKQWNYHDANVVSDGGVAAAADLKGNSRISIKLKVQPFRQYHVAVRIKTQDLHRKPEIQALAGGRQLCWESLGVKPTQDWTVHHAVFNSEEYSEVTLYFGVWGADGGSLWWSEPKIEEVAFLNMPRRAGCPLTVVRAEVPGQPLAEGSDFEPLTDPLLGQKPYRGEYDTYHEPPVLRTKLPNGTKLLASYYNAQTLYEHQAMICPSEPKTMELLRDQAVRMHRLWGAKGYMMTHDEIRMLDWCEACQKRHLTPGELLADNVRQCIQILREVNPGGRIYTWSDMFDPNHNALKGPYYLVNGSLENSWAGLDKDVIVLTWGDAKKAETLQFFAARGNQLVVPGYYDNRSDGIAAWLEAAKATPGSVRGVMYTSWVQNYRDLESFAKAAEAAAK